MTSRYRWTRSSCRKALPTRRVSCLRRSGARRLRTRLVSSRETRKIFNDGTRSVYNLSLFFSKLVYLIRLKKVHGTLVTKNSKAAHTDRRFLCPKLCETAPDDSYRGGIPRGSRTFGPRLNDLPRLSLLVEAPRTRMTSLAIPRRPITTLAAPRSRRSSQGRRCLLV